MTSIGPLIQIFNIYSHRALHFKIIYISIQVLKMIARLHRKYSNDKLWPYIMVHNLSIPKYDTDVLLSSLKELLIDKQ